MAEVPLATRMRPRALDEVVGQRHLLGPGKALTALVESGHLPSLLVWGPAGSGKTTLAFILGKKGEADQLEVGCREPNRDGEECEEHIVQAARPTPAVSAVSCQLLMVDELEGECCVARVVDGLAATHGSQDSAPAVAVDSFPPVVIPGAVAGPKW